MMMLSINTVYARLFRGDFSKPKHGGIFIMALDNQHQLEEVPLAPATFRVYLYDDHTKPLKAEETKQAGQGGDSGDAPKIDLLPGKEEEGNAGGESGR
jgi:hypothetical protein